MNLSKCVLLAIILIALPVSLFAQEKSWVGELVLNNKPARDIKFGDRPRAGDHECATSRPVHRGR